MWGFLKHFLKFIYLFIYLFIFSCLGSLLQGLFSSCGDHSLLIVAVHRLLTGVASLVAEHGSRARSLQ